MNNSVNKTRKLRNLGLCPITPDPVELLRLIQELREYVRTIDFRNDSIYEAYFWFEYNDVNYRMNNHVLATTPDTLHEAEPYITEKLYGLGATNVQFHERSD